MLKQYINPHLRCQNCNGKGWVNTYRHGSEIAIRRTCPSCIGKGTLINIIRKEDKEYVRN